MTIITHKFYIIRHGETDANVSGRIQGSSDFSKLTTKGKEQAKSLGKALAKNLEITNGVYVSPLSRARDTLSLIRIVHDKFGRDELILDNLREIDFYDWEGKMKDELIVKHPESWEAWKNGQAQNLFVFDKSDSEEHNIHYPLLELWSRAERVWETIHKFEEQEYKKDHQVGNMKECDLTKKSSVLICHGTLGQALLGTSLRKDSSFFGQHVFPNCGMVEIEWSIENIYDEYRFNEKAMKWRWFWPANVVNGKKNNIVC